MSLFGQRARTQEIENKKRDDTGREIDRHGVVVATAAAAKEDPGRPRLRPASSAAAAASSRRPHRPPDLLHQRRREQQQCVQEGAAACDVLLEARRDGELGFPFCRVRPRSRKCGEKLLYHILLLFDK